MLSNHLNSKVTKSKSSVHGNCLTSFQRKLLEKNLDDELPWQYRQRIKIMLLADEGKTQSQICKAIGCSLATARHWMLVAKSGQAHQWNNHPIGRPQEVNEQYLERLKQLVTNSPKEFGYAFQRWTANWLSKHLAKEFGIELSDRHINRLLKQMGLSTKPKPPKAKEIAGQDINGKNIVIRDLSSDLNLNPSLGTLSFNSFNNKALNI
ncbi:helix-turn-helix domain-containing protein [Dapis sp. BLCC M126]|uniref:helix-turn-helix domain-containing protein n=1 Tax=Dapis sp. BLCC M126 TaxID=3400189 RepID=UPI003CE7190A